MSALNRPDNFAGRVNYAAAVISAGRRVEGRAFDNCFENYDGDIVAVALMRRAKKNPKLAANMFRFISETVTRQNVIDYAHIPTRALSIEAAKIRAKKRAKFDAWLANLDREQTSA